MPNQESNREPTSTLRQTGVSNTYQCHTQASYAAMPHLNLAMPHINPNIIRGRRRITIKYKNFRPLCRSSISNCPMEWDKCADLWKLQVAHAQAYGVQARYKRFEILRHMVLHRESVSNKFHWTPVTNYYGNRYSAYTVTRNVVN